ncbi:phosphoribosylaminoimidazolesuccinocarboxamide synthase [candidate division KSB1 bacterium]
MVSQAGTVVTKTEFKNIPLVARGKVRDIYDLGDSLLLVASDRISAYDVVMNEGIPAKGNILTAMTLFWLDYLADVVENHLISADPADFPASLAPYVDILDGRSMVVRKASVLPIECVVRGYLAGSGWREYKADGTVCGIPLPSGLKEGDQLPEVIFTPATKAAEGHDINISPAEAAELIGREQARLVETVSKEIYRKAAAYAETKGIILADTKFEFGTFEDRIILIDEILTPDSSRFWPRDGWAPGGPQPSFDKQYLRDYLDTLDWDKTPPPPPLPTKVIENTAAKYREALNKLTGRDLN